MGRVSEVFEKFRISDGRVRVKTASGVLLVVGAVALALGILPAIASSPGNSGAGVTPAIVNYGGGAGACSFVSAGRLPSAAAYEAHTNNPMDGPISAVGPGGLTYTFNIDIHPVGAGSNDKYFDVSLDPSTPGVVIYDIVVNGGSQNNHYDYDGNGGPGTVTSDTHLHAPKKGNRDVFKLSHINICFDVPGVAIFECGNEVRRTELSGTFTEAIAVTFPNAENSCTTKRASFLIVNTGGTPNVTLTFAGDGTGIAAGRIDITKNFPTLNYAALKFVRTDADTPKEVPWCILRDKVSGDGEEFHTPVAIVPAGKYPTNNGVANPHPGGGDSIVCKVREVEDASGKQLSILYYEFIDPRFS